MLLSRSREHTLLVVSGRDLARSGATFVCRPLPLVVCRLLDANDCSECIDGDGCVTGNQARRHFHGFGKAVLQRQFMQLVVEKWLVETSPEEAMYVEIQAFYRLFGNISSFSK